MKQFPGGTAYVYPYTFTKEGKKSVGYATADDANFIELLREDSRRPFDLVIIFVGKASSDSLEIITLLCGSVLKDRVMFVSCDHEQKEKLALLASYGIPRDSEKIYLFRDNVLPCRESFILVGMATVLLGG